MRREPADLAAGRPAVPGGLSRRLGRLLGRVDVAFDRLFGTGWNPLYQSGSIAFLCLAVATVTGLYLFLFYSVDAPYRSVLRIEEDVFLGGLVRSVHRYSADLAVVALLVHLVRKVVQGHTWGPRALAWTSGVLLTGVVLLCGWTGIVMAWDVQGQMVAVEGARLLDLLPVFSEPISRTFSGVTPVPSSFFFMNLFLHVALPLGLVALVWLHLSRVARPGLWPPRRLALGVVGAVVVVAAVFPAVLPPRADLLELPGRLPLDIFYSFWLPVAQRVEPEVHLALWAVAFVSLAAVPSLARFRRDPVVPSVVDEARCTGCTQCYVDCPYDAIAMVPRGAPSGLSEVVARVDPARCVGCGICIGSCAPMGIGPEGFTGRDQLAVASTLSDDGLAGADVVALTCGWRIGGTLDLPGVVEVPTGCSGSVHTSVIELLLRKGVSGVAVVTCPDRDCLFREGPSWLEERVWKDREAELRDRVDKRRVAVLSAGRADSTAARTAVEELRRRVRDLDRPEEEEEIAIELECEIPEEAVG